MKILNKVVIYIKRWHKWMKKDCGSIILSGITKILFAINGFLISDMLLLNTLNSKLNIKFVPAIIMLILSILLWGAVGIIQTLTGRKFTISVKYKLLLSLISIPLLISINKLVIILKTFFNKYGQQTTKNN